MGEPLYDPRDPANLDPRRQRFIEQGIQPPAPLYLDPDDQLLFTARTSISGLTVLVSGRLQQPGGQVIAFQERLAPTNNRLDVSSAARPGDGFLLSISVTVAGAAVPRGGCYVTLRVRRATGGTAMETAPLWQGYVASDQPNGWPWFASEAPVSGRGIFRNISGTDPAAGAEVLEAVPSGATWRLHALSVTLVTSAVAANRVPNLLASRSGGNAILGPASAVVTASLTRVLRYGEGLTGLSVANAHDVAPIALDELLRSGEFITTGTTAIDAGDNYGAPLYTVEEWLSN
jgi:hypothetical protein